MSGGVRIALPDNCQSNTLLALLFVGQNLLSEGGRNRPFESPRDL